GANHIELMRAPEEPGHSRDSTCASFFRLDMREVPHDACERRPYRPSHQGGPGNGPGRRKEERCGRLIVQICRTARFTSPARTTTTWFRPSRRTRRRHTRI